MLIVEDNPDLLEMTTDLLTELGCDVTTAVDGPSGLARLSSERFAIALIDIGLPGLDGYELVRRARALVDGQVRLVAMSGYGQAEDRERALAAGCDLHLTKPVGVADLRRVLAETAELSSRAARL
ncbi:MAG: response regulator [Deltaproteobacteria bacterium]|nr:response regulator [Deltaproteobacteria bacterium]MDQ3301056.1 response regulator [Myxococcota bacterium]